MSTAMQDTAAIIANSARIGVELAGLDKEAALDVAISTFIETGHQARTRGGIWARQTSTAEIDAALFQASVAKDARDNTARPSTGPMRDYVLSLI
jgi:hypothetical protein